jgi:hypothetical protein
VTSRAVFEPFYPRTSAHDAAQNRRGQAKRSSVVPGAPSFSLYRTFLRSFAAI